MSRTLPQLSYSLITPARNEAAFIKLTIDSVVAQTVRPVRWIIVSDGSTDGTDEIVQSYCRLHEWIELLRMPPRTDRHFAGKVCAFNAGYARLEGLEFDLIGNLDGDVSFDSDYFEFLLSKFLEYPRLGVGGTAFTENNSEYDYRFTNIEHVSGQCQVFRKECFADIGGYIPRRIGGIDLVAVNTARMKGWQTRTFLEKRFIHHRVMGTALRGALRVPFHIGQKEYALGNHPLWQLFRCVYQATRRPFLIGGVLRLIGFAWAMVRGAERDVSQAYVEFVRKEQMYRLRRLITRA